MDIYLGIDVGGTNIKTAVLDDRNECLAFFSVPTESKKSVAETSVYAICCMLNDYKRHIKSCCISTTACAEKYSDTDTLRIRSAGAGIPAILEGPKGPVVYSPNLGTLTGTDFVRDLSLEFAKAGLDIGKNMIFMDNDASCAALAESHLGAGADYNNIILLTLGTGVGGAVISDKKLLPLGKYGGELGHFPFIFGGKKCPCGIEGCFEQYANASAFAEFGFEKYTDYLAAGIAGYINIFRPDAVILAGGVTNQGEPLFAALNHKLKHIVFAHDRISIPPVLCSTLGQSAGACGAAVLGKISVGISAQRTDCMPTKVILQS